MPRTLTKMTGKEVVDKIIDADERDFEHVVLKGFDFSEYRRAELDAYLRAQDLQNDKLNFVYAQWERVKASGLYIPHTRFTDVQMSNVVLSYANVDKADFYYAKLHKVSFQGAERTGTIWRGSTFTDVTGLGDKQGDPDVPKPRTQSASMAFLENIVERLRPRI